MTQWQ
jgi:hypothetical protein